MVREKEIATPILHKKNKDGPKVQYMHPIKCAEKGRMYSAQCAEQSHFYIKLGAKSECIVRVSRHVNLG